MKSVITLIFLFIAWAAVAQKQAKVKYDTVQIMPAVQRELDDLKKQIDPLQERFQTIMRTILNNHLKEGQQADSVRYQPGRLILKLKP